MRFRPENTKKLLVAFADLMNNIKTTQINTAKVSSDVAVPLVIATAEKLISRMSKTDDTRIFAPVMSIDIKDISVDDERQLPVYNKVIAGTQYSFVPVPYNYTMELSIFTKRNHQLYEIIEQIVPFYQKSRSYPLVNFKFTDGSQIVNDVLFELTAVPTTIEANDMKEGDQSFRCEIMFNVKAWIYGFNPSLDSPSTAAKLIENIDLEFESMIGEAYEALHIQEDSGEEIDVSFT